MADDSGQLHGSGPLVSVIVPVFNCAPLLARTLSTIVEQDYRELEILLVDDGSTDSSGAVCDDLAARDQRVRVFHTSNRGPSSARNVALDAATGAWIMFVDGDDPLEPGAIRALVEAQLHSGADVVVGDFVKDIRGERSASGHRRAFQGSSLLEARDIFTYVVDRYLQKPNWYHLFVYCWGRLLRGDIIRDHQLRFDESLFTYEDVAFNFDYLRACRLPRLYFLDRVLLVKTVPVHDGHNLASMHAADKGRTQFGYLAALPHIAEYLGTCHAESDHESRLRHALVVYTIIQLVRVAGQWNAQNSEALIALVRGIVEEPAVRAALGSYKPTGEDSRILPLLIRLRWVRVIIAVCRWKSSVRYGREPAVRVVRAQGVG